MSTYEYHCTDCNHDFALEASVAEYEGGLADACLECGSPSTTRRLDSVLISTGSSYTDALQQGGEAP